MIHLLPAVCWLHVETVSAAQIALADNLPAAVRAGMARTAGSPPSPTTTPN